ncbi:transposase [Actinosynnema sp. NPDC047251]|uniref:transposase n=1 Tax=Saccharothrix espanaensis TaxID=103731 RepID=UPI002F90C8AA
MRGVVERLITAGQWKRGDPEMLVVFDAGYDAPRIAYLLGDLPVRALGRMRSDRVLRRPTPPRVHNPLGGRFPKHGGEFVFGDPGHLVRRGRADPHRNPSLRHRHRTGMEPPAPTTDRRSAWIDHNGPQWTTTDHRGHRHPPDRGAPALRRVNTTTTGCDVRVSCSG